MTNKFDFLETNVNESDRKNNDRTGDNYVIRYTPNRIIKFIDTKTKWWYYVILLIIFLISYTAINPVDPTNKPQTNPELLSLLAFLSILLLLPFYIGVKLGANLYRPRESRLTKKTLRTFDQLLNNVDEDIEIVFVKQKSGKVAIKVPEH